jgi:drug/metabolite transporter (DMT)-like permease
LGSLLLALTVLPGGLPALPAAPRFWGNIVYLVLFATLFAFFAQNYALRRTSPSRVALLTGSEPVFGALIVGSSLWAGLQPARFSGSSAGSPMAQRTASST